MKDIKQVIEEIKKYIDTDISEIIEYHENKNSQEKRNRGHHSIACLIFCCIDYLSAVVYGKNNANPVKFIEEYFKDDYKQKALLVYKIWRHGTVHENDPKILTDGNRDLGWCTVLLSSDKNKKEHLRVFQKENNPNQYCIVLNLPQLVIDLKDSIEKLIGNLNSDYKLSGSLSKNYRKMTKAENVNSINKLKQQFDNAINIVVPNKVLDQKGCVKNKQKNRI
ncbi:MAG: hypothetical protein KAQ99_09190 [Candidatus Aureabacteria bacterium]|nr:hypothetical protein [Candidatus Auribacterota bacterium]